MGFEILKGKTLKQIIGGVGDDSMKFIVSDDEEYELSHEQDCCESVTINDICGDIADLIGEPILRADEVTYENENPDGVPPVAKDSWDDSWTWTFYKLATIKGSVTIRWFGQSNGYYSERVDFRKV